MQPKLVVHEKSNGNYELRRGRKYLMSMGRFATLGEFIQHYKREARALARKGESVNKAELRRFAAKQKVRDAEKYMLAAEPITPPWVFTPEEVKAIDKIIELATGFHPIPDPMPTKEEAHQTRSEQLQRQFRKLQKERAQQLAQMVGVKFVKIITDTFVSRHEVPHVKSAEEKLKDEIRRRMAAIGVHIQFNNPRLLNALASAGDAAKRLIELRK